MGVSLPPLRERSFGAVAAALIGIALLVTTRATAAAILPTPAPAPTTAWRARPVRPALISHDAIGWSRLDPGAAPDSGLIDPPPSVAGRPLWRARGSGMRLAFQLHRRAQLALGRGDTATAESCWTALARGTSPWRWEGSRESIDVLLARGDTATAERLVSALPRALAFPADGAERDLYLARIRAALRDTIGARRACNALLENLSRSGPFAYEAVAILDRLPTGPRDSLLWLREQEKAAEAVAAHGDRSGAVARLRRALNAEVPIEAARRWRPRVGLELAELLRQSRRFSEALAALDSIGDAPGWPGDSASVLLARARTLRDAARSDTALAAYIRIATQSSDPSVVEIAWWEFAREAEELGRWSEARGAYARIDSLRRGRAAPARLRLGWLWFAAGDRRAARLWFARDTSEAARFGWALCVRDSEPAAADSALQLVARQPGYRYYAVCARESLIAAARRGGAGPAAVATEWNSGAALIGHRESLPDSTDPALRLARALIEAGLVEDAAALIERWAAGGVEAGAAARESGRDPAAILTAVMLENAAARYAPALRIAQRAADDAARGATTQDPRSMPPWEVTPWLYPPWYGTWIDSIARDRRVGLEPALLHALVWKESRFDSAANSRTGARGLTQLMPATAIDMARRLGEKPPPESLLTRLPWNLRYGAAHLRLLLDRFGGRVPLALAAYNSGISATERWSKLAGPGADAVFCELIAYDETRDYVKSILAARQAYRDLKPFVWPGAAGVR